MQLKDLGHKRQKQFGESNVATQNNIVSSARQDKAISRVKHSTAKKFGELKTRPVYIQSHAIDHWKIGCACLNRPSPKWFCF